LSYALTVWLFGWELNLLKLGSIIMLLVNCDGLKWFSLVVSSYVFFDTENESVDILFEALSVRAELVAIFDGCDSVGDGLAVCEIWLELVDDIRDDETLWLRRVWMSSSINSIWSFVSLSRNCLFIVFILIMKELLCSDVDF